MRSFRTIALTVGSSLALLSAIIQAEAQTPVQLLNTNCTANLDQPVTEIVTGRTFVLDYPCDLRADEQVTLILNLHGGGSNTAYQRAYFPAWELKEKYRLGGAAPRSPNAGRPRQNDAPPPTTAAAPATAAAPVAEPDCDFSHIYAIGEHEITELPQTSALAGRYQCSVRVRRADVVDTEAGKTYDSRSQNPGTREWGLLPRPGTAQVYEYPDCDDGRVIADVVRIDKGHTEGLEPRVMDSIVSLMVSARGGKVQNQR